MTSEETETGRTRSVRTVWAAAGTLLIAVAWAALAGRSPDTTYHFAPALVAWGYPYLRLSAAPADHTASQALGAVAVGAAAAVATTFALEVAGWLEGPVLVGGDALGESLLVAGLAAVAAGVIASVTAGGRE